LSEITVGANLVGSLIRVFTTVQDFDKLGRDKVLLAGYGLSLVLNLVLAGQVWYYGQREKEEKEKKDR
jgi:mannose-P-dolichol utilization defect protein 1